MCYRTLLKEKKKKRRRENRDKTKNRQNKIEPLNRSYLTREFPNGTGRVASRRRIQAGEMSCEHRSGKRKRRPPGKEGEWNIALARVARTREVAEIFTLERSSASLSLLVRRYYQYS